MSDTATRLSRPRGDYGFDGDYRAVPAPVVAVLGLLICAVPAVFTVVSAWNGAGVTATISGLVALLLMFACGTFLRATRRGKFEVWARVLDQLGLRGDERALDLGCGRGAVLLAVAKLLPYGQAVGVDIWRADQTGNSPDATRRNAELEGVADRVSLHTANLTQLPFAAAEFDVIVSSLAIHNLPDMTGRLAAIDEAVRVLEPGGQLAIADIGFTKSYAGRLRELGMTQVRRTNLGWRFWCLGPLLPTHLVTATKPTDAA